MNDALISTIAQAQAYLAPDLVDCVIYHSPCNDGSGAAVAAWMKCGNNAIYERRMYHKEFPREIIRGKHAIVLDASFSKEELLSLRQIAKKVMILDHHHSAMLALADVEGCFFEMNNSGAMLSWHYFHGVDTTPPRLLSLIEDRDLWRWQDRESSEPLYYALRQRCPNSNFKSYLPYLEIDKLDELIAFGKTLVAANHKWCEQAALTAKQCTFTMPDGTKYQIIAKEVDNDNLVSELAEYLYTRHAVDFIMMWCKTADGRFKVSFRANNPQINVAAIATAFGGGGHKQAAGAVLNFSPWQLTEI